MQAGIPRNPDFNGAQQEGCGYYQTTTSNRRRWSTAKAYLHPARQRANLVVQHRRACHARADREQPCGRRRVPHRAGRRIARARGEVIVSGGAYGSPQLLLLSGLGPAQHLQDIGVSVVRDMPAVGSNLHDHFNSYVSWRCSKAITLNDLERSPLRKLAAGVRYALFRSGPMASNGIHCGLFTRSDPRLERPDVQINVFEWSTLERNKERRRAASVSRLHAEPGASASRRPRHSAPGERRSAGAARGAVRLPAHRLRHAGGDLRHPAFAGRSPSSRRCKPYIVHELQPGPSITDRR